MPSVFVLHHAYEDDAGCDEVKLIGVYATEEAAQAAIARLSTQPGFRDRTGDFHVDAYELDEDNWAEGYGPA